jgi:hypothetical protein
MFRLQIKPPLECRRLYKEKLYSHIYIYIRGGIFQNLKLRSRGFNKRGFIVGSIKLCFSEQFINEHKTPVTTTD